MPTLRDDGLAAVAVVHGHLYRAGRAFFENFNGLNCGRRGLAALTDTGSHSVSKVLGLDVGSLEGLLAGVQEIVGVRAGIKDWGSKGKKE